MVGQILCEMMRKYQKCFYKWVKDILSSFPPPGQQDVSLLIQTHQDPNHQFIHFWRPEKSQFWYNLRESMFLSHSDSDH